MPTEFLTDAQELMDGHYSGPPSNQQLEGYFHLDDADLEWVKVRRGAQNKFGFALQLTTARFLGTFLTEPTDVPPNVVAYVAAQLGIRDVACLDLPSLTRMLSVSFCSIATQRPTCLPSWGRVDEVWIVNVPDRQLEATDALGTRVLRRGDHSAPAVEGVTVDLAVLFADLDDAS